MRKACGGPNGVSPVEPRKINASDGTGEFPIAHQAKHIGDHLGSVLRFVQQLPGAPVPGARDELVTETFIREIIRLRRKRDQFFADGLFADPAWDILLKLYLSEISQQRVTITSLSAAASVPPTTALRWIASLERKGLIGRRQDPTDGRRIFVSLTPDGLQRMENYFRAAPSNPFI